MSTAVAAGFEQLLDRKPELAEKFRLADENVARISTGTSGPFLEACCTSGWLGLHSRYDSSGEACRIADTAEISESRFVVLLGLGAGHTLEEILKRVPADAQIVAIEPEAGILKKALEMRDFSSVLMDPRVMLFVGVKPSEIARKLDPATWGLSFRQPRILEHPSYAHLSPAYLEEMRKALLELFEIEKSGVATRCAGQRAFTGNILKNLPRLSAAAGVLELFGLFKGRPAVLVSAGPSLNKQLPQLKELQGRAVIICVDTAMRSLLSAGIRPDIVAAVDFTPVNFKHFDGVDTSQLPIVAASIVYPRCLEVHSGPVFSLFNEYPITDWLMPLLGVRGQVTVGDSTAHTCFHLAERMGCNPIILIGQDLAYTGGKTHAEGVATRADIKSGERLMVPGWYGSEVSTSSALMTMLKHFEGKIADCKSQVINATEGGARIDGANHITFAEAVRSHCVEGFSAREAILKASALRPALNIPAFRSECRFVRRRVIRSRRLAHEGIRCIRRLIAALCENDVSGLESGVANLEAIYGDILSDGELLHLLQAGMELSLMQLRWPDPASGAPFKHDFLVELVKDRRFLNDLCVASADFSLELKACLHAMKKHSGTGSGQTGDWIRHSSKVSVLKGGE